MSEFRDDGPDPADAIAEALDAHTKADDTLLSALPLKVREAYRRVQERAPWWASRRLTAWPDAVFP